MNDILIDNLKSAVRLMEQPETYEIGRYSFLSILDTIPERYYAGTMFSFDTDGTVLLYKNPSLRTEGKKTFIFWETYSPKGTLKGTAIPFDLPKFFLTAARNIAGQAEASRIAEKQAKNEQETASAIMAAIMEKEYQKMETVL